MPLSSRPAVVERARALLGTVVSVRAVAALPVTAQAAIEAAFAEIADIHRLMSFQDPDSDLSRLHRQPAGQPVRVDSRTAEVLAFAIHLAERSDGVFDPTVGAAVVAADALPRPRGVQAMPDADWREVRIEGRQVTLRRPVWLDLGGVAKGYAVDRALARMRAVGAAQGLVNAGGDLAVFGGPPEPVRLRAGDPAQAAVVMLEDGAMASSGGDPGSHTIHLDGRSRRVSPQDRFACVLARTCMAADALTKVALAGDWDLVLALGASGLSHDPADGWRGYGDLA